MECREDRKGMCLKQNGEEATKEKSSEALSFYIGLLQNRISLEEVIRN